MSELLLKHMRRHVLLSDAEGEIILQYFIPKKFRKHQFILQEDQVSDVECFVLKGLTRTYEIDAKGREHIIHFGPEEWWIGDMSSFLLNTPSDYHIDCIEDTEVLQITREAREELFKQVPRLERYYRILVQNAYIAAEKRINSSQKKSALERYLDFIAQFPLLEQRVPNHQIASYLGVTPQSLSRLRSRNTPK